MFEGIELTEDMKVVREFKVENSAQKVKESPNDLKKDTFVCAGLIPAQNNNAFITDVFLKIFWK